MIVRRCSIAWLLVLVVLTLGCGLWSGPIRVNAATTPVVSVTTDRATVSFPDGIDFRLKASAGAPVERVELLYATVGNPTLTLLSPPHQTGTTINVSYRLDLLRHYLPPGVDVEYRWRFVGADGDATETAPKRILWLDTRFDWVTYRSTDVELHAYNKNDDFNDIVLDSAQRTADRLKPVFGLNSLQPVRLWIYQSNDDFAASQAPNSEPWVVGTAYVQLGLIVLVLPPGNPAEVRRTVPHEMTHQVLYQATKNPFAGLPTWLDEGLAVYNQEISDPSFPGLVDAASDSGQLDSIQSLTSSFPYDTESATLAYAESVSIVDYIVETFGRDAIPRLTRATKQGLSYGDAVHIGLGISIDELDRRWTTWLADGGMESAAQTAGPNETISNGTATGLASGAFVMTGAALLALVCAAITVARNRRSRHLEDDVPAMSSPTAGYL